MTLNPTREVQYRLRLAEDHLARAEKAMEVEDWAGAASACQLAIENFAKAIIAVVGVPGWSHDPSHQLEELLDKFPEQLHTTIRELASLARQAAPEHGRTTYGDPAAGLTPSDLYGLDEAEKLLSNAKHAHSLAQAILRQLHVS